jgi:hypothetical protein
MAGTAAIRRNHDDLRSHRRRHIERFRAKWIPVRVKKTRQNKKMEHDPKSNRIMLQIPDGKQEQMKWVR